MTRENQPYDRSDIRRLNAINILDTLKTGGPMSRAGIAARSGLTRATVSNIASDLIAASLIIETEYDGRGQGRPGLLMDLNPDCGCMVGLEIDLDRLVVVLANAGMQELWRDERRFESGAARLEVLEEAARLVQRALQRGRRRGLDCLGVCVAWAGLVDRERGELAYGPTFGWKHVPLKADWEKRFGVPVAVENEAHAAAIGAYHFGPTRREGNLIYASLGVGLAAGVFVDGVLLRGSRGYAGQVGHMPFADNGVTCDCGKQGCWLTEVGLPAVRRKLTAAGVRLPRGAGGGRGWVDAVCEMAAKGDPAVQQVITEFGWQMGRGLAQLVQTFNPSVVITGGHAGRLLVLAEPAMRRALAEHALPHMAQPLELLVSISGEDHLRGCLATVLDRLLTDPAIGKQGSQPA